MLTPDRYHQHMVEYLEALAGGDGAGVASRLADDVKWHVGGSHPLSGTYETRDVVAEMLGRFKERSGGTVRLIPGPPMMNGDLCAITLKFSATRPGKFMSLNGIDVFRLGPGGIEEVWLFTEDQEAEDAFWGD